MLPDTPQEICSMGVLEMNLEDQKWLYICGGIVPAVTGGSSSMVMSKIYRLNLNDPTVTQWEDIGLSLPYEAGEVSVFQFAKDKIMILGGWNKGGIHRTTIIQVQEGKHMIYGTQKPIILRDHDFFTGSETFNKSEDGNIWFTGVSV